MLTCLLLFAAIFSTRAAIYMEQEDKYFLETHPIEYSHIDIADAIDIVHEEYEKMSTACTLPPANIKVIFDESLLGSSVLAWASQNMKLKNLMWQPSLFSESTSRHFTIALNPIPPNGWYIGDCKYIHYQYDLRTIVRHEILHGIGLGSSITFNAGWSSGVSTNGLCFPRMYDTFIVDEDGKSILNGCNMVDISNKKLYIGDVELYHPDEFRPGSSLSHHNYAGYLFYYKTTHSRCMQLSKYEAAILEQFQVQCSVTSGQKPTAAPTLLYFLILRTLFSLLL